ncbi:MAG: geranylgeranyl reductase [Ferruginibacter sp.]|nr:geranylgeranyl reductase [Ferruginibacter sp.]
MIFTKVCIIGAGPAGAAAALQLNKDGIDCIVVDKAIFPRDKVCGDGLSGKVITALKRIDPEIADRLQSAAFKLDSYGVSFVSPGRHQLEVGFRPDFDKNNVAHKEVPIGYVCKRIDFDHFLVQEMKQCKHIEVMEGIKIEKYTLEADGYLVSGSNGFEVKAELIIIANGAHSSFTKDVAGIHMEPAHYLAGIRAYYKNVSGTSTDGFIELHFLKKMLPGYFWIFPLPNGEANVGVGLLSEVVSRKKVNLKKELQDIIQNDPVIKERFKNAELMGSVDGYGLPLGSKKRTLSGERYMLTGDAAFLIDPFTGEGIGNAFYSGRMAAQQASLAIQANDYTATGLARYDSEIDRVLGSELRLSHRLQKLNKYPWLFNMLFKIGTSNKQVKELLSCMFYEVDVRKKLTKPSFYLKLLFNR